MMTLEEEGLTEEVEVEEEAKRLYIDAINVSSWIIEFFSILRMKRKNREMHM